MSGDATLLPVETLADRCARHGNKIAAYERDITNGTVLNLTEIRVTLLEAADTLSAIDETCHNAGCQVACA